MTSSVELKQNAVDVGLQMEKKKMKTCCDWVISSLPELNDNTQEQCQQPQLQNLSKQSRMRSICFMSTPENLHLRNWINNKKTRVATSMAVDFQHISGGGHVQDCNINICCLLYCTATVYIWHLIFTA